MIGEIDLVSYQRERQLVERWHLRMVVAVVSDRHPHPRLAPNEVRVRRCEIPDHEERRVDVQPLELAEDARGVLGRGAVVEGQRNRSLRPRGTRRPEPRRDQLVRDRPSHDHPLARHPVDKELRIAGHTVRLGYDGSHSRLGPVTSGHGDDPVAASRFRLPRGRLPVHEDAPGKRSDSQHPPIDVEEITGTRTQPKPRCDRLQRRALRNLDWAAGDRHSRHRCRRVLPPTSSKATTTTVTATTTPMLAPRNNTTYAGIRRRTHQSCRRAPSATP